MICNKDKSCCNSSGSRYLNIGLAMFLGFMVVSLFTMMENPLQKAVNEVAETGGWDAEDMLFNAGTLTVLMSYARVGIKVQVQHVDGSSTRINAVVKRYPFYGYVVSCFATGDNDICVGDLGRK